MGLVTTKRVAEWQWIDPKYSCICTSVHLYICTFAGKYRGKRSTLGVSTQVPPKDLCIGLQLADVAVLVGQGTPGSFCLPSTEVTNIHQHMWLLLWAPGVELRSSSTLGTLLTESSSKVCCNPVYLFSIM